MRTPMPVRARCPQRAARNNQRTASVRTSKPILGSRRAGYIYMRISPFLEDFAVRRQGVPVLSAQFVRVSAYIPGALRTTRPTSFGSGYADPGTDAPYPEVHGESLNARGHLTPVPPLHPMEKG